MLLARSLDGELIEASPDIRGSACPTCGAHVIPKCGKIISWHWAHDVGYVTDADCRWPESDWHRGMKKLLVEASQFSSKRVGRIRIEATVSAQETADAIRGLGQSTRRADILGPRGVVELQKSGITAKEVYERNEFWRRKELKVAWLFDCRDVPMSLPWEFTERYARFCVRLKSGRYGTYNTFRWKHPRKTVAWADPPVYLDFGEWAFQIQKMHPDQPCGGWGYLFPAEWLPKVVEAEVTGTKFDLRRYAPVQVRREKAESQAVFERYMYASDAYVHSASELVEYRRNLGY